MQLYVRATGETFWGGYWARQLGTTDRWPTPEGGDPRSGHTCGSICLRMLWHPAPWSFALAAWLWQSRRGSAEAWRHVPNPRGAAVACALSFAIIAISR